MFRRPDEKRIPTIKALAYASIAASGVITLLVTAGLLSTSWRLESATETMFSSAQSFALAREAQIALLMYQRIGNLYTISPDPELAAARDELLAELRAVLGSAAGFVSSPDERAMIADITELLDLYVQQRTELEAGGADIRQVLQLTQPASERLVEALEALHDVNERQVLVGQTDSMRWNRIVSAFSGVTALVLISGLIALAFGLHHAVLRPILDLHETIARFRAGSAEARATASGLREVRELAHGFNEMADALAKQRENQLAFLAGVAHDLKNPLHALRLGIHALSQERSEPERDRTCKALDRQLDHLARMVEDLLDVTRIEAGKLEMRFEEFDLRIVVEDMIRLYAPTSPDHRIGATVPPQPVLIEGDLLRLEQVLSNLLSNAIKYSPRGGAICVAIEQTGDEVELSVADEGIGIRPEQRSDIFLPFRPRQADAPAGSGLGLSVVRRIVEAHGGRIEIESGVTRGTLFRVVLRRNIVTGGPGHSV